MIPMASAPIFTTDSDDTLANIFVGLSTIFTPPERLTVSQAAEKYRIVNSPGSFIGEWDNSKVPYMVRPADMMQSRRYKGVIFCGPAQTGKTDALLVNGLVYTVKVDPMDAIIYSPTQTLARDFSLRRVDRLHRHSPEVGRMLLPRRDSDNVFDKHYKSGIIVSLSYPTTAEFSGRPVPRIWLTDYDRMPMDVEGEGAPYDMARKRTTTFGSFAMTVAESSPSQEPIEPTKWVPKSLHEAPPTSGILALYNRGTREQWYWPCPYCTRYFRGAFELLEWDTKGEPMESAETVRMVCPHCAGKITPDWRYDMNLWGTWLADGQTIGPGGRIIGKAPASDTVSFWLNGTAAAFISWSELVTIYLTAMREFDRTGKEEALKKFYNNDIGTVYIPRALDTTRLPEALKSRAEKLPGTPEEPEVPSDVRFIIATVDVQTGSFVAQIFGIAPGMPFDMVLIDRFRINRSERVNDEGDREWVKPGVYQQDWDLIEQRVMERTYRLSDGSNRRMGVRMTGCDSGGRAGVTTNAYDFYRALRRKGKHGRFHLLKGDSLPNVPRTRITFPDSNRKDQFAVARGDVPVLFLNSNMLKDALANRLECVESGKGMLRFADWMADEFYSELCAEQRTPAGWINPPHQRNEAWDLSYYAIGICVSTLIKIEVIDWGSPPAWAETWDKNALVTTADGKDRYTKPPDIDFGIFAKQLA